MMKESWLTKAEHDRLVQETANEVLSRISATVDVSEVIAEIDELQRHIDNLGK